MPTETHGPINALYIFAAVVIPVKCVPMRNKINGKVPNNAISTPTRIPMNSLNGAFIISNCKHFYQ